MSKVCFSCNEPFTDKNVHTRDGWLETEISGLCVVKDNATITHQEHHTITIPAGTYRIGKEREYDPFTESMRDVRD